MNKLLEGRRKMFVVLFLAFCWSVIAIIGLFSGRMEGELIAEKTSLIFLALGGTFLGSNLYSKKLGVKNNGSGAVGSGGTS